MPAAAAAVRSLQSDLSVRNHEKWAGLAVFFGTLGKNFLQLDLLAEREGFYYRRLAYVSMIPTLLDNTMS
jgi:hypothetical protein